MLFRFLVMSELLKIPVYFVLFSSLNKAGPLWKKISLLGCFKANKRPQWLSLGLPKLKWSDSVDQMARCVYRLLRRRTSGSADVCRQRRVQNRNLNNSPSWFPFADHANVGFG